MGSWGLGGGVFLQGASARAATGRRDLSFAVYREGDPIGEHRVQLERDGPLLRVVIDVRLEVKFAFIPFYRYLHTNREIWDGGRLRSLESRTDDNGVQHQISARSDDGRLVVEGTEGRLVLPAETVTTTYWDEATVRRGEWLDTQSGRLARSTVTPHQPELVRTGGGAVEARRYVLAGDLDCELWYDEQGWASLRFVAPDGSTIDYRREYPT